MPATVQISAIDIKKLWYAETSAVTADLTGTLLSTILRSAKEITNVHQDTWTVDESEPTQDSYRNQLTGNIYRFGAKLMGEVTFNFTIGRYDYVTKKDLLGGDVINTDKGWKRARGAVEIKKCLNQMMIIQ